MTPNQQAALNALLATHGDTIRALLPTHLHHLHPFKVEQFGPLTKYTLGEDQPGIWAMLHHLSGVDTNPPHNHPCAFHSYGIVGDYLERVYRDGGSAELLRTAGTDHLIAPDYTHQIIGLPQGEAWTLVFSGPVVQECRHFPELLPTPAHLTGRADTRP